MQDKIYYIVEPYQSQTLTIGARCEQDLFDRQGMLIIMKGEMVTSEVAHLCREHRLYVLRASATNGTVGFYYNLEQLCPERFQSANDIVNQLVQQLQNQPEYAALLKLVSEYDYSTYIHGVHVATIAVMIGMELGDGTEELQELAMGGLFHDIGKLLVPQAILTKPSHLTPDEYGFIRKHPTLGTTLLQDTKAAKAVIDVVMQHHERWNGQGYPLGLKGDNTCRNAQIAAVADVFDAVISDRPYRFGLPPHHAIEMLLNGKGELFSPAILAAFLRTIAIYPEKTKITLNTGETAIVTAISREHPTRPIIRLLADHSNHFSAKEEIINLVENPTLYIAAVDYGGAITMNIMLIDDDKDCLEGLQEAIEPAGYTCESFTSAEQAVAKYSTQHYDIVITDMKMPGMTGLDVLKAIRAHNAEAKVIIITGYGDVETAIAAVNYGAYAFFGKPVDIGELLETMGKVQREIEKKKRIREQNELLAIEYNRLKKAYEDMQQLLKGNLDQQGENEHERR